MMECWEHRTALEKKSLVTLIVLLTGLTGLITLILLVTEPDHCYLPACTESSRHIQSTIDGKVEPCDNFNDFVCGKTPKQRNVGKTTTLKDIILEPVDVNDTQSLKLQKQFYQSCKDLESIDADKDSTFLELISKLGGWPVVSGNNWNESAFDFSEMMVELRDLGLQHDWFLDISVYSNRGEIVLEINVPDNANKIEEEVPDEYIDLMMKTAMALGAHENVAKSQMSQVKYFENKLANLIDEIHNANELKYKQKPLELIGIEEVQKKWQKINWLELLNHLTRRKLEDHYQLVAFYVEDYMPKLDKLLKQTTKRTQVNYVIWKLVEAYSPFLSKRVRDLMHNYSVTTNQTDLWYTDREDFCLQEAKSYFQYTLEAAYLRRQIPESKRKSIEVIIERVLDQMEKHLHKVSWMDEAMRRSAINRSQNISYIIGGPEEMYYAEQFDKDFGHGNIEFNTSNIIEISVEMFHKGLETLFNKKYENTNNYLKYTFYELVTSQEMVFYEKFNLLWVPAGFFHSFLFDEERPNYLNYGTLGTKIAQELVHGLYAALFKNLSSWPNTTLDNFNKAVACLKNCTDDEKLKCDDNLLENMSDYIGVNLSYLAYAAWLKDNTPEKKLLDLNFNNKQLFWVAYGSLMCHLPVPDPLRIIGPFRNSPYFSQDFECALGSHMNPRNKCQM